MGNRAEVDSPSVAEVRNCRSQRSQIIRRDSQLDFLVRPGPVKALSLAGTSLYP